MNAFSELKLVHAVKASGKSFQHNPKHSKINGTKLVCTSHVRLFYFGKSTQNLMVDGQFINNKITLKNHISQFCQLRHTFPVQLGRIKLTICAIQTRVVQFATTKNHHIQFVIIRLSSHSGTLLLVMVVCLTTPQRAHRMPWFILRNLLLFFFISINFQHFFIRFF